MGCLGRLRVLLAIINIVGNGIGFLYGIALVTQASHGLLLFNALAYRISLAVGILIIVFFVSAIIGSILACCPNAPCVKCVASTLLIVNLIVFTFVFVFGMAAVIYVYLYRNSVTDSIVALLDTSFNESYSVAPNATHYAMSLLQTTFNCCGINGPDDFNTYPSVTTLPLGCCATETTCTPSTAVILIGCSAKVRSLVVKYYIVIGLAGISGVVSIFLLTLLEGVLLLLVLLSTEDDSYE